MVSLVDGWLSSSEEITVTLVSIWTRMGDDLAVRIGSSSEQRSMTSGTDGRGRMSLWGLRLGVGENSVSSSEPDSSITFVDTVGIAEVDVRYWFYGEKWKDCELFCRFSEDVCCDFLEGGLMDTVRIMSRYASPRRIGRTAC